MVWTPRDMDWFAARLLPAIHDINRTHRRRQRIEKNLTALHRELNAQMKIRITEPVFFFGKDREAGEMMDVPIGPYRTQVIPGGLKRIPQFVEMAEENTQQPIQGVTVAAQPATQAPPAPGTFAEATAAALKPAPAVAGRKPNPLAARVRALTTRRAKFQDQIGALLNDGEKHMTTLEDDAPGILTRANNSAADEVAAITDLDAAMKEFAATNGEIKN